MERLTRTESIRKKCLDCSDGQADVRNCLFADCPLHPGRMKKRPSGYQPSRAIKEYCLECCDGQTFERKFCPVKKCPLHPYRCGKPQDNREDEKRELSHENE